MYAWREGMFADHLVIVPYIFKVLEGALVEPVEVSILAEEVLIGDEVMFFDLDLQVEQSQDLLIVPLDPHEVVFLYLRPD